MLHSLNRCVATALASSYTHIHTCIGPTYIPYMSSSSTIFHVSYSDISLNASTKHINERDNKTRDKLALIVALDEQRERWN